MIDIECPLCKTVFDVDDWIDGHCPTCDNEYIWNGQCTEEYMDCWSIVLVEKI